MPVEEEGVVGDWKGAEVVVFKGDLNYRKLVGDVSFFSFLLHL